ncbi:MAG: ECF transporter S component [Lachnospiraceae bacterium]|nr:ECF transporter S component [Lachnospiraceae bacterium]
MEDLKKFISIMSKEAGYVIAILAFVAALFIIAIISERVLEKDDMMKIAKTKKITLIGIFAAVAGALMYFEFPMPFAPSFYGIDLSEVPVMISGFMLGPVAGVATEFVKIIVKLAIKPTSTAFIGEFANFIVGCTFVIPASIIYKVKKNKKMATIGLATGTVTMIVVGCFVNAFILLPAFARFYGGMPMSALIAMGTEVNANITNMFTFIILAVAPLNLIKGLLITIVVTLVYKKISKLIKTII